MPTPTSIWKQSFFIGLTLTMGLALFGSTNAIFGTLEAELYDEVVVEILFAVLELLALGYSIFFLRQHPIKKVTPVLLGLLAMILILIAFGLLKGISLELFTDYDSSII